MIYATASRLHEEPALTRIKRLAFAAGVESDARRAGPRAQAPIRQNAPIACARPVPLLVVWEIGPLAAGLVLAAVVCWLA